MPNLAILHLLGHLGRTPKLEATAGGTEVCSVSMAVNHGIKDKETGAWKDVTNWYNMKGFGKLAVRLSKANQGDVVYAVGKLEPRKYIGKDNTEKLSLDVILLDIHIVKSKTAARETVDDDGFVAPPPVEKPKPVTTYGEPDDDIPF